MDYSRVQADLAGYSSIIQHAIGQVMADGFGIETSDTTNMTIFYGLIVLALYIALRVRKVRARGIAIGGRNPYRRFGLDRYKQI